MRATSRPAKPMQPDKVRCKGCGTMTEFPCRTKQEAYRYGCGQFCKWLTFGGARRGHAEPQT